MTDDSPLDPALLSRIDTSKPHQARVWNYWLGGKDNYPADRELARKLRDIYPGMEDIARHSRVFLGRAVRYVAGKHGVRQFLDIGTGLPTVDHTHEVAQRVDPASRVVYVDNDPLVLVHARALLSSDPRGACDYIEADVREPGSILEFAAGTLDFDRPVALMLLGVMGTVFDDDEAYALVRRLMGALAPGSYLVFEDGTNTVKPDAAAEAERLRDKGEVYEYRLRTPEEIARFFDGLELVEPGIVSVSRWRLESDVFGLPPEVDAFCGVARKP
ncbi:SAM-dependent methyltransferase [Nonomuraea phyllanthi]|uniref:SAM-dependent methyltransferase n=1 Tax=Nonomuraea phyllanthi TaxID=2219224 RepID=A0A5C4WSW4_9ACTN|nr:SAM-dependent methyltransferase [Nonomuraea phyllanthi]KAB8196731.1 SAM-dependent methyltransferase [Nonomuraea phyllanthi]QFY13531.1 SAM-dependent methyltransferase [Nonomuraea phyllanthi]